MGNRTDAQVIVVGGGPVGMLVAAELAGRGVDTLVLETRATVSERPKATTLHARTAQCLARRGYDVEATLCDQGPDAPAGEVTMPFHFAGMPGLSITAPATEPRPILKVPQARLERMFEARAREEGVHILREHTVTGLVQDDDGVRVDVEGPGGSGTYTAAYAVGADGARGPVRAWAGIVSDTFPATLSALMGLVRLGDRHAVPVGWHRTPRGWIIAKDGPDGMTHLRTLSAARAGTDRHRPLTMEEFSREATWIAGRDIAMTASRWLSRFSDFARLARSYRAGRVFLAGDAAHVHFPVGGQGLSTGLLDALNLGWKLALAVHGTAGDGLLDTYDLERRPAAQRVIDNTRAQVALMRPDPGLDPVRQLIGGLLNSGQGNDYLGAMISAQDTVLPSRTRSRSPWEGTFLYNVGLTTADGPTDVVELLREGKLLLLLSGERGGGYAETARGWAQAVRVVRCAPTAALPCAVLLVRPDGYIAWTPDGGELDGVLTEYLGPAGTRPRTCDAALWPAALL